MKDFFSPSPMIIANNGALPGIPPGTGRAVEEAFRQGADAVYLTVRLTSDGVPVVVPAEDVFLKDGGEVKVSDIAADQLDEVDAGYYFPDKEGENFPLRGKGEKYLSLGQLLQSFPEEKFILNLDGDSPMVVKEVVELLAELGSTDRIVVSSVSGKFIREVRKKLPAVPTAFSSLGIIGVYFLFRSGLLSLKKNFDASALFIPEAIGPSYMGNRIFIREVRSRGIAVCIWNVKSVKEMHRLKKSNVDGYITDDLPELLEIIRESEVSAD